MNSEAMPVNISKVRKTILDGKLPSLELDSLRLCLRCVRGSLKCVVTMQWSEIRSLTFMAVTRSGWLVA